MKILTFRFSCCRFSYAIKVIINGNNEGSLSCNLLELKKITGISDHKNFFVGGRETEKGEKQVNFRNEWKKSEGKKSNIWIKASRLMFKWLNNWFIKMLKHQTYVPWTPTKVDVGISIFIYYTNLLLDDRSAVSSIISHEAANRKTIKTAETNRMQFKMLFLRDEAIKLSLQLLARKKTFPYSSKLQSAVGSFDCWTFTLVIFDAF